MTNTPVLVSDKPLDPREVERLSAVRVGRVPSLKKFDSVWHYDGISWHAVVVERRCPGGVYWARIKAGQFRGFPVVVSCGSYGGLV
jgi:hypothetical protein